MKALAAEVTANFGKRLAPLGLTVRELTGEAPAGWLAGGCMRLSSLDSAQMRQLLEQAALVLPITVACMAAGSYNIACYRRMLLGRFN
jgi:hypothetical protein